MIEWGQKLKPPKKTEKNPMPNFQAIKFPESIKINTDITITNLQIVLNTTQKNPYLTQAAQKILAKVFLAPKIPEIKYFKSQKLLQSSQSLEIRSTPWVRY